MEKYFTVFDNTPHEKASTNKYNYIGIAACSGHDEHIDIAEDPEGKASSKTGLIIALLIVGIVLIGTAVYCYI